MNTGMIHRLRVLLLEPNRYLALLMEREIAARYRSSVTARFDNRAAAIEELNRTRYDVAVVDVDQADDGYVELLADMREARPKIVLIVMAPQEMIDDEGEDGLVWADRMLPKHSYVYRDLPNVIALFESRWQEVAGKPGTESILDADSRSAVINLTVRTLAHEINNPLMTIMGTAELLLDKRHPIPPEQAAKVRMIQDSARRIQTTLSDLSGEENPATRRTPVGLMLESRRPAESIR